VIMEVGWSAKDQPERRVAASHRPIVSASDP